jgi:hypothetical protein
MVPIDLIGRSRKKMREIRSFKSFALHNVSLLPNDLFERSGLHNFVEDEVRLGAWKPFVVNGAKSVPGKAFVQESLDHSLRLENALKRLTTERRVVLLHYSPVRETVLGENPEIFPFVGSSRLENPINQFNVSVVFHGHAHNGSFIGKTSAQIPVFNVAFPVISKQKGQDLPLFVYEI